MKVIKYGDPRIFAETKLAKPFTDKNHGIQYDKGAIVRQTAYVNIGDKEISISLPSMAELVYFQSSKLLEKATKIKKRALLVGFAGRMREYPSIKDEELFYTYIQCCSLGILGLYSSIESMVYELYIRRNKSHPIKSRGKKVFFKEFTSLGFDTKITSIASQLSGKKDINGTELFNKAQEIKRLRTLIQHCNIDYQEGYFINLPDNHPLKEFIKIHPSELSEDTRAVLDHYSLKPA